MNDALHPAIASSPERPLLRSILLASAGFGILNFVLPIYAKSLGASALNIGGLFSAFALVITLLRPVVGWGIDRYSRKLFLIAAMLLYGVSMALFAVATSVTGLYLARLVQGLGSSFLWISAYTLITELRPGKSRGNAVGSVDGASAQGSIYGGTVALFLLGFLLPLETGWPLLFGLYALLAFAGAALAWRQVPETHTPPPVEAANKGNIHPLFFRLMVIVFLTSTSSALIQPILMVFLQDRFTTEVSTLALAYLPSALVYAYLPSRLGGLSDRLGRTPLMAAGLLLGGMVSLLMPRLPNLLFLIVLWVFEALGFVLATPAEEALVADLTGSQTRGTGYGLYMFAAGLGFTLGPLMGGWLYDAVGHTAPFTVNGLLLIAGSLLVLLLLGRLPMFAQSPAE